MAKIKAFRAWRPASQYAKETAALPYDVYNREEARRVVANAPLSFLNIDRPETQFASDMDIYDAKVYAKADELLKKEMCDGIYIQDEAPCLYLYELTMDGHSQTGIVACVSVDDYVNNVVKKHENTRAEKEQDRIRHVDACSAQTGPIFLAFHHQALVCQLIDEIKQLEPIYDFTSDDNVTHRCWKIDNASRIVFLTDSFEKMGSLYIADGHHRAASAVKVCLNRRKAHPSYDGSEEFNSFLAVLFPENQLKILPYYRVVRDLNGYSTKTFLNKLGQYFNIKLSALPVEPEKKYVYGFYVDERWYRLELKTPYIPRGPVESLDVSVLQNLVLAPILGIKDPKTDYRIDFVGGIRGTSELECRCHEDMKAAFSTCATTMQQLIDVADAGMLMPPKSTWFEPKLRSGLFIHEIER